eukprot:1599568-Pyramimonas_sp.AAC.1
MANCCGVLSRLKQFCHVWQFRRHWKFEHVTYVSLWRKSTTVPTCQASKPQVFTLGPMYT